MSACEKPTPEQAFKDGDYEYSFAEWQPLAKDGNLDACYYLGLHYYLGLAVDKNNTKARQWFELAATKGHPAAQLSLGTMYQNGGTVPQNFSTAYMWYYASAIQGNTMAPKKMSVLFEEMKLLPNQIHQAELDARPYIVSPQIKVK